jgi:hypothetical protein
LLIGLRSIVLPVADDDLGDVDDKQLREVRRRRPTHPVWREFVHSAELAAPSEELEFVLIVGAKHPATNSEI